MRRISGYTPPTGTSDTRRPPVRDLSSSIERPRRTSADGSAPRSSSERPSAGRSASEASSRRSTERIYSEKASAVEDKPERRRTPGREAGGDSDGGRKKGGGKKAALIIICCVLGVAILLGGAYLVLDYMGLTPARKQEAFVQQTVTALTLPEGVDVDGVDISGLTFEEAKAKLEESQAAEDHSDIQYVLTVSDEAKTVIAAAKDAAAAAEQRLQDEAAQAAAAAESASGDEVTEDLGEELTEEQLEGDEVTEEEPVEEPVEEPFIPVELEKDANGSYIIPSSYFVRTYNTEDVLNEAFMLARKGTYDELVAELEDIKTVGRSYNTEFTVAPGNELDKLLESIAYELHVDPVDASFFYNVVTAEDLEDKEKKEEDEIIDPSDTDKFQYIAEVSGLDVDTAALKSAITDKVSRKEYGEIEIPTQTLTAEITEEHLRSTITLRSSFYTKFGGSNYGYPERVFNITKASGLINGKIVQPGETFSTNDAMGVRTRANGWKDAGALSGGETVKQPGGGVCQVATTLYNAVVRADMEIVYRQNHTQRSGYVDGGMDATINSVGNMIDFKWKNNTNSPIIVVSYVIGYRVYVDIYGEPFSGDFDEIQTSSKKISDIQPTGETVVQVDPAQPATYVLEKVKRRVGSKWQSYKIFLKDGEEIRREELAESVYRAYDGLTIVGAGYVDPAATPEPAPAPAP